MPISIPIQKNSILDHSIPCNFCGESNNYFLNDTTSQALRKITQNTVQVFKLTFKCLSAACNPKKNSSSCFDIHAVSCSGTKNCESIIGRDKYWLWHNLTNPQEAAQQDNDRIFCSQTCLNDLKLLGRIIEEVNNEN